jgi:ElaB/YqjD/DUF883 family membrane-anchored ribosome-binding protein
MENQMNRPNEPESTAQDILHEGARAYEETKRSMSQAYQRSAGAIGQTYDQALDYGRNHPGKAALIAFGIGVGVGLLLVSSGRRSRISRYGEPLVNVLSNIATDFIRKM